MEHPRKYRYPDYMKAWRAKNATRIKAWRREYYRRNRQKQIAHALRYVAEHYDRHLLGCRAYSANRKYPGRLTRADVEFIFTRDQRTCYWCGKSGLANRSLTLEHLQPVNTREAIVTACLPCNASRRSLGKNLTPEQRRERKNAYQRRYRARKAQDAR